MTLIQRLRRSIPFSLSRCRSAGGTWTTTTSATGMPSLDSEPPSSRRPHLATVSDGQRRASATDDRVNRQRLLTSDYESSDSPSSSEHGEHVVQRPSVERRRDAVPDTTDIADRDLSPSPSSPPCFNVELAGHPVRPPQYWRGETLLVCCYGYYYSYTNSCSKSINSSSSSGSIIIVVVVVVSVVATEAAFAVFC